MQNWTDVLLFFELIGTITFSCSGAMIAIRKKLDLLGVVVLGVITATGGGMLRDIILGQHPPLLFLKSIYVCSALMAALFVFLVVRKMGETFVTMETEMFERSINALDAVGLGVFTVVGVNNGIQAGYEEYHFLIIFLGVITGIGGGVLRDLMVGEIPYVLKKHIYACASIIGAVCYINLLSQIGKDQAMLISSLVVVLIRFISQKYKLSLPHAI